MWNRHRYLIAGAVIASLAASAALYHASSSKHVSTGPSPAADVLPQSAQNSLLSFEPNVGQTANHIDFLARARGYTLFLSATEAVFALRPPVTGVADSPKSSEERRAAPSVLTMSVVGANPDAAPSAEDRRSQVSHYIRGNDPSRWQRDVPHFGSVRYRNVYEGVDLVYYGKQDKLEYDFVVAPGHDPDQIQLDFRGVEAMDLDEAGNLMLKTAHGTLLQYKPIVYQVVDGARRLVEGAYALLGDGKVGFSLGQYDLRLPLVIDPILTYSTYLGGNGWDSSAALAIDGAGTAYVVGNTNSTVFPWDMGNDSEFSGVYDAYGCRFPANGIRPYCAYIGGSGDDAAWAVAVGAGGDVFIAGYTESHDFPLMNPHKSVNSGIADAFLLKLDAAGTGLHFSTYIGGQDVDVIRGLAAGPAGTVYATGNTSSLGEIAGSGAFQTQLKGGSDAFVTRYSGDGAFLAGTYLGGSGVDAGRGIAVDAAGNVYVSGFTESTDFPVPGAMQASHGGAKDAFIAKLSGTLSQLGYGTFHGGMGDDYAYDIRFDRSSNVVIAGMSSSPDLPTTQGVVQSAFGGETDGFLLKMTPGGARMFSSYLGGSGYDDLRHIALDPAGNIYWAGYSRSADFPRLDAIPTSSSGTRGVLTLVDASGKRLLHSSTFGGDGAEIVTGVARSMDGTLHLSGYTFSSNFPLAYAFQTAHASPADSDSTTPDNADIFLTRLADATLRSWAGDFNGDGVSDVLWRNVATGAGAIWPSAQYSQAYALPTVADLNWQIAGVDDFDNDGRDDILWRNGATGANRVWRGGNDSTAWSPTTVTNLNWKVVGTGDFNGDGRADVLWRDSVNGFNAIWYSGNSATSARIATVSRLSWEVVAVADFSGDGKDDILWRNSSTGQNAIWRSGDAAQSQAVSTVSGTAWRIVGVGDFDRDAKADILWRSAIDGRNVIWKSASSASGLAISTVPNHEWQIAGTGDYNGDGHADILWRQYSSGANAIWLSGSSAAGVALTGVRDSNWIPKS